MLYRGLWGCQLDPKSIKELHFEGSVKISMATLGKATEKKKKANRKKTSVNISFSGSPEYTLCSLKKKKCESTVIDLTILKGEKVSFINNGFSPVHLIGNYISQQSVDSRAGSSSSSSSSSEEEEEEEEEMVEEKDKTSVDDGSIMSVNIQKTKDESESESDGYDDAIDDEEGIAEAASSSNNDEEFNEDEEDDVLEELEEHARLKNMNSAIATFMYDELERIQMQKKTDIPASGEENIHTEDEAIRQSKQDSADAIADMHGESDIELSPTNINLYTDLDKEHLPEIEASPASPASPAASPAAPTEKKSNEEKAKMVTTSSDIADDEDSRRISLLGSHDGSVPSSDRNNAGSTGTFEIESEKPTVESVSSEEQKQEEAAEAATMDVTMDEAVDEIHDDNIKNVEDSKEPEKEKPNKEPSVLKVPPVAQQTKPNLRAVRKAHASPKADNSSLLTKRKDSSSTVTTANDKSMQMPKAKKRRTRKKPQESTLPQGSSTFVSRLADNSKANQTKPPIAIPNRNPSSIAKSSNNISHNDKNSLIAGEKGNIKKPQKATEGRQDAKSNRKNKKGNQRMMENINKRLQQYSQLARQQDEFIPPVVATAAAAAAAAAAQRSTAQQNPKPMTATDEKQPEKSTGTDNKQPEESTATRNRNRKRSKNPKPNNSDKAIKANDSQATRKPNRGAASRAVQRIQKSYEKDWWQKGEHV